MSRAVSHPREGTWSTSISQIRVDPRPERRSAGREGGLQVCRAGGGVVTWGLVALWFWRGLLLPPSSFPSFQIPDGVSGSLESHGGPSPLCPETSVSLGRTYSVIVIRTVAPLSSSSKCKLLRGRVSTLLLGHPQCLALLQYCCTCWGRRRKGKGRSAHGRLPPASPSPLVLSAPWTIAVLNTHSLSLNFSLVRTRISDQNYTIGGRGAFVSALFHFVYSFMVCPCCCLCQYCSPLYD